MHVLHQRPLLLFLLLLSQATAFSQDEVGKARVDMKVENLGPLGLAKKIAFNEAEKMQER